MPDPSPWCGPGGDGGLGGEGETGRSRAEGEAGSGGGPGSRSRHRPSGDGRHDPRHGQWWGRRPPPWWPENEAWPPTGGPGSKAWGHFGRRLARLAALWALAVILMPLLLGVILAVVFGGWASVAVAIVSWIGLVVLATTVLGLRARMWWPVRSLIETAGRVADGDYAARAHAGSAAPMRSVVHSFNRMAERLEAAEVDRRQLLADVGHELRTPLTIIRGELEAMADGVHELDHDRVRRLLGDVRVMERLLDDLATLSRAEAGTLRIHREPTDIVRLATDAVDGFAAEAIGAGITLGVDGAEDNGSLDAEVDPVRVHEIVSNLVANALRATPAGGSVGVRLGQVVLDGSPHVSIVVTDTGRGIPDDELDRVFDRFHSGPDSDGSGLGLTITANLVEAHGGAITMASTLGEGTTATVHLPAVA